MGNLPTIESLIKKEMPFPKYDVSIKKRRLTWTFNKSLMNGSYLKPEKCETRKAMDLLIDLTLYGSILKQVFLYFFFTTFRRLYSLAFLKSVVFRICISFNIPRRLPNTRHWRESGECRDRNIGKAKPKMRKLDSKNQLIFRLIV